MPEQSEGAWPSILLALLPFVLLVALGLLWWRFRQRRATKVVVLVVVPAISTALAVSKELREGDYGPAAVWAALGGYVTVRLAAFLRRQPGAPHQ